MHGDSSVRMFDIDGRTLGLFGTLNRETCLAASEAIMRLGSLPATKPLHLYLGCSGGTAADVFLLLDCLMTRRGKLHTYAMCSVEGLPLLLFAEGDKRNALPHAVISTKGLRPSRKMGFGSNGLGTLDDSELLIRPHLERRLGQTASDVLLKSEAMSLEKAVQIGLVHQVINSKRQTIRSVSQSRGRRI